MGRAIVRQPAVFLMDEPLSNLDAKLRVQMRAEIAQLQHRLGVTTIYVTHDQTEAMTMGHRVALLRDGVLQQVDTPDGIYNRPRNTFVATFIGSPTMNLYFATLGQVNGDGADIALGSNTIHVPPSVFDERPALATHAGKRIIAGFRPEDVEDNSGDCRRNPLRAGCARRSTLSRRSARTSWCISGSMPNRSTCAAPMPFRGSMSLRAGARASVCVARLTPKSRVALGQPIQVAVDATRMHFFDPDTHETIDGR